MPSPGTDGLLPTGTRFARRLDELSELSGTYGRLRLTTPNPRGHIAPRGTNLDHRVARTPLLQQTSAGRRTLPAPARHSYVVCSNSSLNAMVIPPSLYNHAIAIGLRSSLVVGRPAEAAASEVPGFRAPRILPVDSDTALPYSEGLVGRVRHRALQAIQGRCDQRPVSLGRRTRTRRCGPDRTAGPGGDVHHTTAHAFWPTAACVAGISRLSRAVAKRTPAKLVCKSRSRRCHIGIDDALCQRAT